MPAASRGQEIEGRPSGDGRVLLLSMREVSDLVGYAAMYEFEDCIAEVTGAALATPASLDGLELSRRVYRLARGLTRSPRLAEAIRPRLDELPVEGSYELFLAVFNHPYELFALKAVPRWRERCRRAVCYISEARQDQLPVYLLELLRGFDHVFLGVRGAIDALARTSGRPCTYLPMGVDTLRFCPHPNPPARFIDVCGIGRRSPVTHDALLELARETGMFYFYDTIQSKPVGTLTKQMTFRVSNPREHRLLFSQLLKRSRHFIANRAWADRFGLLPGEDEIAARFYEGAASGAIMLGDPPDSEDFRTQFDWADAVVPIPFDAPRIAEVVADLDAHPARSSRIRRDNMVNALLRHDWVYRLRALLDSVGMAPTASMLAREARLRALADDISGRPA